MLSQFLFKVEAAPSRSMSGLTTTCPYLGRLLPAPVPLRTASLFSLSVRAISHSVARPALIASSSVPISLSPAPSPTSPRPSGTNGTGILAGCRRMRAGRRMRDRHCLKHILSPLSVRTREPRTSTLYLVS